MSIYIREMNSQSIYYANATRMIKGNVRNVLTERKERKMGLFNRTREEMEKDFAKLSQEDKEALLKAISTPNKEEVETPPEESTPNPTPTETPKEETKVVKEKEKPLDQKSYAEIIAMYKVDNENHKKFSEEAATEINALKEEVKALKEFKSKFDAVPNGGTNGVGLQKVNHSAETKGIENMSIADIKKQYAVK